MISRQGLIFDIQRYSVHDGPGIRTIIFLKGCPLRCHWCSNPEGQKNLPELAFRRVLCINCRLCVDICPRRAIRPKDSSIEIDRSKCDLCGECVKVCTSEALSIIGKWFTVEQMLTEIERDLIFYDESRGGITLSGGEPLAQADFLEALTLACKSRGISIVIETSGYASWASTQRVVRHADLILYDLKHVDPSIHHRFTGVSNKAILENLARIADLGVPLIARYPVVPGFNDDPANAYRLFQLVSSMPKVKRIELTPYHRFGESKYSMIGRRYTLKKVRPPTRQSLDRIMYLGTAQGLRVNIVA